MMPSWICDECGQKVSGWEGEHGTYHGVCKHCGEGYGIYETNQYTRWWYEAHKNPLLAVCFTSPKGKNTYVTTRQRMGDLFVDLSIKEVGTVMTVYDVATRTPIDRARSRIGWEWTRSISDVEWMEAHGVKA